MMMLQIHLRNASNWGVRCFPQRPLASQTRFGARWMELGVRRFAIFVAVLGLLGACDAPEDAASSAADGAVPVKDPNTFRADVSPTQAYAGEWAVARNQCENEKKVWTIETNRMAIEAERFCAFENIYMNNGSDGATTTWSTSARCLAEGRESHDFLFFRVEKNLREMRVTFNDSNSVDLIRCPMKS
jgi:hypothetical protein